MNINKARDFFSAYYEGELGGGIKEAFERSLTTDPALKSEYEEFVQIMKMLEEPIPEVPAPHDLHEKIMTRLDHQTWEAKQSSKAGLFSSWRLAFFGGLAAFAIIGGALSINQNSNMGTQAGPIGIPVATENVDVVAAKDGKLILKLQAPRGSQYIVRPYGSTEILKEVAMKSERFESEVSSNSEETVALEILDGKGTQKLLLVHPGTRRDNTLVGEGSVIECAQAIASAFRTPILVRVPDPERQISWNFESGDDHNVRSSKLAELKLNLSLREDGVSILAGS